MLWLDKGCCDWWPGHEFHKSDSGNWFGLRSKIYFIHENWNRRLCGYEFIFTGTFVILVFALLSFYWKPQKLRVKSSDRAKMFCSLNWKVSEPVLENFFVSVLPDDVLSPHGAFKTQHNHYQTSYLALIVYTDKLYYCSSGHVSLL